MPQKGIPTHKRAILGKTCTEKKLSANAAHKISDIIKNIRLQHGHEAAEEKAEELTELIDR